MPTCSDGSLRGGHAHLHRGCTFTWQNAFPAVRRLTSVLQTSSSTSECAQDSTRGARICSAEATSVSSGSEHFVGESANRPFSSSRDSDSDVPRRVATSLGTHSGSASSIADGPPVRAPPLDDRPCFTIAIFVFRDTSLSLLSSVSICHSFGRIGRAQRSTRRLRSRKDRRQQRCKDIGRG